MKLFLGNKVHPEEWLPIEFVGLSKRENVPSFKNGLARLIG